MLKLRHTITLTPVPRPWFEEALRTVRDSVEELREENGELFVDDLLVPGVRLAAGHHIGPGASYEFEDTDENGVADPFTHQVLVEAWHRTSVTRLRYKGAGEGLDVAGTAELDSGDAPKAARWSATMRGSGSWARYRRAELRGNLDLRKWWAADRRGDSLTVGLHHPLATGLLKVRMSPEKDGRWKVTVVVTARGRGWARPPAALAALFGRSTVHRQFVKAIDHFAEDWNKSVPEAIALTPDEIRAVFRADVTES